MSMANLTHISFSDNHRHFGPKLVEHELWKLSWHLQKFIFFHKKLCFCQIIIKIDLQIITQITCTTYILVIFHFLRSTSHLFQSAIFFKVYGETKSFIKKNSAESLNGSCSTNIYTRFL